MESDLHFHCCASNNGMLTSALSIVVRQTMACWHHHFPLLCVTQCNADVSTFHCVSLHTETHFVPDQHMEHVETDSVWRVIEGKWCFGSGIRIHYPDHHQNLMNGPWVAGYLPIIFRSNPSITFWVILLTDKQTDRQTDRQTNRGEYITSPNYVGECNKHYNMTYYIFIIIK